MKQHIYPFVKWAGGKTQLLIILDKFIPNHFNNYIEPFLGGGALYYHLVRTNRIKPFRCFLSDSNCELINAYNIVKDQVEELIESLLKHQNLYYQNPFEYYYSLRAQTFEKDFEKASRFIALNKTCFNGLYRVNRDGKFNVPMGKFKKFPTICDHSNLRNLSALFRDANPIINCTGYKQALCKAAENDFIYLDPPYRPLNDTAYFTKYTNYGFTDKDQKELASLFKTLDKKKCKVLLSNSNTDLIRELYTDYNLKEVNAMRAINSIGSKRLGHTELIINNYGLS